jgi:TRAP-type C4-dicarboxylate transport system substrate-binding protein
MERLQRKSLLFLSLTSAVFLLLSPIKSNYVFAAKNKTVTLKVATYLTPSYGDGFYAGQELINYVRLFGGKHNLDAEDLYHSQTVYKAKEMLPACITGSLDIIILMAPYAQGTIPAFGASDLPFIWKDNYVQREGSRRGSPYFNFITKECGKKNLTLLSLSSTSPEEIISLKPLRSLDDLKGVKIRVTGASHSRSAKALGLIPLPMPSSEIYTSLQRGVIDASMGVDVTFKARKLYEVAKYQLNLGAFLFDWALLMNKTKFDKLTQDQKNVILNASEIYRHAMCTSELISDYKHTRQILRDVHGVEQIYLSPTELERVKHATGEVEEWWKKQVGEKTANEAIKAIKDSHNWRKSRFGKLDLIPLK